MNKSISRKCSVGGGWGLGWAKSGWFISRLFSYFNTLKVGAAFEYEGNLGVTERS